jgi:hypothetical protein
MTTKDCVYLGVIGLTALFFYCRGFFVGVSRAKRVYESLLGAESEADNEDRPLVDEFTYPGQRPESQSLVWQYGEGRNSAPPPHSQN